MTQVTGYAEARKVYGEWRPQTKKRQGAQGMEFDYLPVQDYENFLDATVGADHWESFVETSGAAVAVRLVVFGVSKSSTSDIWPSGKLKRTKKNGEEYFIDNLQP